MKKFAVCVLSTVFAVLVSFQVMAAEPAPSDQQKAETSVKKPTMKAEPAESAAVSTSVKDISGGAEQSVKVKIGYVDMPVIAKDSAPGKAAYSEIKEKSEKYKKRIDAKQKDLEKQKAAIESKIATLTPMERDAKVKEFQKKIADFQKYVQNAQKELQTKENELLGNLFKNIEKVVSDYGKANGYAVVADKKGILFVGDNADAKDLTQEVVKLIDAEQGKK